MNGFDPLTCASAWNTPVDTAPLEPNPPLYLYPTAPLHPDFGVDGEYGIPYNIVDSTTCPMVNVTFQVPGESDAGPYPICAGAAIQNGLESESNLDTTNDHHWLAYDRTNGKIYEIYDLAVDSSGNYYGYSGAIFNAKGGDEQRPLYWTSADAAGLPILPGLVKYNEVASGVVNHAIRFTIAHSRQAFIPPATHAAGYVDSDYAPMGLRVRLKASVDISGLGPQSQIIATAMKKYGMILADNGGDWFFQGDNDTRWNDSDLNTMKTLTGADFEVVKEGTLTEQPN